MKTIKVLEATGPALDWLVAKAEALPLVLDPMGFRKDAPESPQAGWWVWLAQPGSMLIGPGGDTMSSRRYSPSTNWAQGGPIIERELIGTGPRPESSIWPEPWLAASPKDDAMFWGATPLIAAMRCYVTSKLGDSVEVPEELT